MRSLKEKLSKAGTMAVHRFNGMQQQMPALQQVHHG